MSNILMNEVSKKKCAQLQNLISGYFGACSVCLNLILDSEKLGLKQNLNYTTLS